MLTPTNRRNSNNRSRRNQNNIQISQVRREVVRPITQSDKEIVINEVTNSTIDEPNTA